MDVPARGNSLPRSFKLVAPPSNPPPSSEYMKAMRDRAKPSSAPQPHASDPTATDAGEDWQAVRDAHQVYNATKFINKLHEDKNTYHRVVPLAGGTPVDLKLETSGQHILSTGREVSFTDPDGHKLDLPKLTVNLYAYPEATVDGRTRALTFEEQEAFEELMLSVLENADAASLMDHADAVGAFPVHGLLVANTKSSLRLSMRMLHAVPELMLQVHAASGPFDGEGLIHVLSANRREHLLVEGLPEFGIPGIIQLSLELSDKQLRKLWLTQAQGPFFSDQPMRNYGGSAFSYMCCFGMKNAIRMTVSEPRLQFLNVNCPKQACKITGYMPLHSVTANGMRDMYNFLSDLPGCSYEVQDKMKANTKLTTIGSNGLLPMQIAAQNGDQRMVKHILRRQTRTVWKWGPVTQYEIDLSGIDSAGEGGNDLMELVGSTNASKETASMVLDSFMNGLLNDLFGQKWERFGRHVWSFVVLIDGFSLLCLVALCFALKIEWLDRQDYGSGVIAPVTLVSIGLSVALDAAFIVCWWQNYEFESNSKQLKIRKLVEWQGSFDLPGKYLSHVLTTICCILIVTGITADGSDLERLAGRGARHLQQTATPQRGVWYDAPVLFESPPLLASEFEPAATFDESRGRWADVETVQESKQKALRSLRARGHQPEATSWNGRNRVQREPLDDAEESGDPPFQMDKRPFALLAVSFYLQAGRFIDLIITPSPRLSIFLLTVKRMMSEDLMTFMSLFMMFMLSYFYSMFIAYPAPNPQVPQLNDFYTAFKGLLDLALIGEPMQLVIFEAEAEVGESHLYLDPWTRFDLYLFILFYYMYVLVAMVLLLNLLIALMGNTFQQVQEDATLQYRRDFARRILRLELIALPPLIKNEQRFVGEKNQTNGKYFHLFRAVEANVEGVAVGGGSNIFDANDDADNDGIPDSEDNDVFGMDGTKVDEVTIVDHHDRKLSLERKASLMKMHQGTPRQSLASDDVSETPLVLPKVEPRSRRPRGFSWRPSLHSTRSRGSSVSSSSSSPEISLPLHTHHDGSITVDADGKLHMGNVPEDMRAVLADMQEKIEKAGSPGSSKPALPAPEALPQRRMSQGDSLHDDVSDGRAAPKVISVTTNRS